MLFDQDAPPAGPRLTLRPAPPPAGAEKALETILFGLPLPGGLTCGDCSRFRALNPFSTATGRCKPGIKPGIISAGATGCGIHRAKDAPTEFDGRAVRP